MTSIGTFGNLVSALIIAAALLPPHSYAGAEPSSDANAVKAELSRHCLDPLSAEQKELAKRSVFLGREVEHFPYPHNRRAVPGCAAIAFRTAPDGKVESATVLYSYPDTAFGTLTQRSIARTKFSAGGEWILAVFYLIE